MVLDANDPIFDEDEEETNESPEFGLIDPDEDQTADQDAESDDDDVTESAVEE